MWQIKVKAWKKGRGRENVYSHEIFSSREVWKKYRLDVCGKIRQPGASRATRANPPTNFQVPSSAKPEWRINEETTGCRFISLVTVFPVSLLRLPCTTTTMATCKRYTRANLPSVWKERERKSSDRVGSFRPTARKLYEVLSATSSFDFTGRRLLLATRIRFNANSLSGGSLSNRRQFSYGRFNFFYIFSFVSHPVTELSSSVPTKIGKLSCNFISFSLPFSPLFIFSLFTAVGKGK